MSHCFKFPSRKWDLSSVALKPKSAAFSFRLLDHTYRHACARARARTHTHKYTRTRAHAHTHTHTHTVWLLWTSEQLVAESSTYTTNTRKDYPCPQRDSNPQSQVSSGLKPHSHRCAVFLHTRSVQPKARRQHFARNIELCWARSHSKWENVF